MPSGKRRRTTPRDPVGAGLAFRGSLVRLLGVAVICAHVALVPLVFDPAADWPFVVPKALLTHGLAYVLAGVMGALVIRFGRGTLPWSWLHIPVLAFLALNVGATLLAEDRFLALFGTHARMLGLGTTVSWVLLYFGVVMLVRTRADFVAIVTSALSSAALMLAYEIVQLGGLDPFLWNTDSSARPFSTNGQPTTLASYFTVLAVGSFAIASAALNVSKRSRMILVTFAGLLLFGAAATATRSPLLGLAAGSATIVLLVWRQHPSRRARNISVVSGVAAAIALVAILAFSPIGARLLQSASAEADAGDRDTVQLDLASLDVRAVLYGVALGAVRERPLFGYGPDNFVVAMTRHRPEVGPDEARLTYATSPHSWIGQVAIGSGLLGLGVFLSIIVTAALLTLRRPFRPARTAAAAGLVAYLATGLTTVNDVGSDWVFWVAAALLASEPDVATQAEGVAVSGRSQKQRSGHVKTAWRQSSLVVTTCLVVGIGMALTAWPAMVASHTAGLSRDSRLGRRVGQAIEFGIQATSADPGRAEYWHTLGLAYVASARWRQAGAAFERAVRSAPWDARYISDLIQTQLLLAGEGDGAARSRAVELADEGVRKDPNFPDIHYTRATVMQFIGNTPEALRSIERAFALAPQSRSGAWYVMASRLYLASGRTAEAIRVAADGLSLASSVSSVLEIRLELARAYLAAGQPQDALGQVDAVLAVDPGNASAQRLRAEIEAASR